MSTPRVRATGQAPLPLRSKPFRHASRIRSRRADLNTSVDHERSDQDPAARAGASVTQIRSARRVPELTHPLAVDTATPDGVEARKEFAGPDELGFAEIENRVLACSDFPYLTEQERTVVRLRFSDDLTRHQIGMRIGISRTRVSRILRRIAAKAQKSVTGEITSQAG